MTEQDAIKLLTTQRVFVNGSNAKAEAIDMAITALEKQISKKPKYYGDEEDGSIECPNCESDLWELKESGITYCPDCGQNIDWGNEP